MLRICIAFVLLASAALADVTGQIRVIDADTLDVGGVRVRLYGIDAPEMDQSCETRRGASFACGVWARDQVARRFGGRKTRCEVLDIDRYDRSIARCRVGRQDMGRVLVREGWAFAFRRYAMDYVLDEAGASLRGIGLHGARVAAPEQFRKQGSKPTETTRSDCNIKGNISKNGRVYHLPGQEFYTKTRITRSRGERWFCSESDARAAGWKRARR